LLPEVGLGIAEVCNVEEARIWNLVLKTTGLIGLVALASG
jgi:hypothetical protein